jgi:hypothetical protein
MSEFLFFAALFIGGLLFLSSRNRKRQYGDDSDHKGCRDCEACVRPLIQRFFINLTWGNVRAPFVMFLSTCPQCSHVTTKHGKRDDGSYLD